MGRSKVRNSRAKTGNASHVVGPAVDIIESMTSGSRASGSRADGSKTANSNAREYKPWNTDLQVVYWKTNKPMANADVHAFQLELHRMNIQGEKSVRKILIMHCNIFGSFDVYLKRERGDTLVLHVSRRNVNPPVSMLDTDRVDSTLAESMLDFYNGMPGNVGNQLPIINCAILYKSREPRDVLYTSGNIWTVATFRRWVNNENNKVNTELQRENPIIQPDIVGASVNRDSFNTLSNIGRNRPFTIWYVHSITDHSAHGCLAAHFGEEVRYNRCNEYGFGVQLETPSFIEGVFAAALNLPLIQWKFSFDDSDFGVYGHVDEGGVTVLGSEDLRIQSLMHTHPNINRMKVEQFYDYVEQNMPPTKPEFQMQAVDEQHLHNTGVNTRNPQNQPPQYTNDQTQNTVYQQLFNTTQTPQGSHGRQVAAPVRLYNAAHDAARVAAPERVRDAAPATAPAAALVAARVRAPAAAPANAHVPVPDPDPANALVPLEEHVAVHDPAVVAPQVANRDPVAAAGRPRNVPMYGGGGGGGNPYSDSDSEEDSGSIPDSIGSSSGSELDEYAAAWDGKAKRRRKAEKLRAAEAKGTKRKGSKSKKKKAKKSKK